MFKRLVFENWVDILPIVGFVVTVAVFILVVIRTVRMKQDRVEHMANLPLDREQPEPSSHHGSK